MADITYLPEVECDVTVENGILDTQVIAVPDEDNDRQFLRVGKGCLTQAGGKNYLPIGIVHLDYKGRRALVELPQEADSGTHRIWVPFARFLPQGAENGS